MGIDIKPIARVSEPEKISLTSNPNFINITSLTNESKPSEFKLEIIGTSDKEVKTTFSIKETLSGIIHTFGGTTDSHLVNNETFLLSEDAFISAENVRKVLRNNTFLSSNFTMEIPFNTSVIEFKSLGAGDRFKFTFNDLDDSYFILSGNPEVTESQDSISDGKDSVNIEIDLYKNTGVFPGKEHTLEDGQVYGNYITSLSKAYKDESLWFDINSVPRMMEDLEHLSIPSFDWKGLETINDFRFTVKRNDGANLELFHISDVFYTLFGYDRTLAKNDLSEYVYDTEGNEPIKLLTTQPELTHTKGQHQYLNFILSDLGRGSAQSFRLGLLYRFYTSHGKLIDEVTRSMTDKDQLSMVNTIRLDLDSLLDTRNYAARVEVCLCRSEREDNEVEPVVQAISNPISFRIMPECLYKVHDFVFLNRLGGWSSFNFPGTEKTDFKTKATTIYQTHTPDKSVSSKIECVHNREVTESFAVETMPITRQVCDWLKELSTSKVVYEMSTGRYIIVDELNIKHDTKEDLFRMEMKYHYSDSYNARIG